MAIHLVAADQMQTSEEKLTMFERTTVTVPSDATCTCSRMVMMGAQSLVQSSDERSDEKDRGER